MRLVERLQEVYLMELHAATEQQKENQENVF